MISPKAQVFLCHASEDKALVREFWAWLRSEGYRPWLDEEDLLPGQEWEKEIPRAVRDSDCILLFLSQHATTKKGYIQKEIRIALAEAERLPEGAIYIIPLRIDKCSVPEPLTKYQWVDGIDKSSRKRLLKTLEKVAGGSQSKTLAQGTSEIAREIRDGIRDLTKTLQLETGQATDLVALHWRVGKSIVDYCKKEHLAPPAVINALAEDLSKKFGSGFSVSRLRDMRKLYLTFPNSQILPRNLTASHFHHLLRVNDQEARMWYMMKAAMENWSVRHLDRLIASLLFERQLLAKGRPTPKMRKTFKLEALRDPYVYEFLGLPEESTKEGSRAKKGR